MKTIDKNGIHICLLVYMIKYMYLIMSVSSHCDENVYDNCNCNLFGAIIFNLVTENEMKLELIPLELRYRFRRITFSKMIAY